MIDPDTSFTQFFFCTLPVDYTGPFGLGSPDGWGRYNHDGGGISLLVAAPLDYESEPVLTVPVVCVDNRGLHVGANVSVSVTDCNDAPRGLLVKGVSDSSASSGRVPELKVLIERNVWPLNGVLAVAEGSEAGLVGYLYVVDEDNVQMEDATAGRQRQSYGCYVVTNLEYEQQASGGEGK